MATCMHLFVLRAAEYSDFVFAVLATKDPPIVDPRGKGGMIGALNPPPRPLSLLGEPKTNISAG